MLHLGCVTYNLLKDWDLETIIKKLEEAGYEAVELRTEHKHGVEPSLTSEQRKQITARFQQSKVRLLSFGSTCEFQSPDAAVRRKQVEIGKQWVDLAHDTNAWGVKVRPNGIAHGETVESTVPRVAECLRELGDYGQGHGVEIWMEVHGHTTQNPPVSAAIMKATKHDNVGLCWNSNPTDVVAGSVKASFQLLKPWIRNAHINDLSNNYPWRELFKLLNDSGYDRYTLAEVDPESKEPERFLPYYRSLWTELNRACA
jgi:sugar phosphate isomerase/epimerase